MRAGLPELARAFIEGLAAGDADAVLGVAREDLQLRLPTAPRGVPRQLTGHAELAGLAGSVARTWTEVSVEIGRVDTFEGDPDRGVMQFSVHAVNHDGSRYDNDYLALAEVSDGLISRWTEYYDPGPMVAALDALRAHVRSSPAAG